MRGQNVWTNLQNNKKQNGFLEEYFSEINPTKYFQQFTLRGENYPFEMRLEEGLMFDDVNYEYFLDRNIFKKN